MASWGCSIDFFAAAENLFFIVKTPAPDKSPGPGLLFCYFTICGCLLSAGWRITPPQRT